MPKKLTITAILFLALLADIISIRYTIFFNQISDSDVLITLLTQIFIGVILIGIFGIICVKTNLRKIISD